MHSVEVLDPLTVQIRLKQPYAFMLHMLAAYRTGLVLYSPAATQKFSLEDRKQGKPGAVVGCGPFRLVEWVKGSHLVMERFDKYFEPGLPYLDRVIIRVIKDPVTEMAAFKAGEIDFIASFSPEHVDTLKAQNPEGPDHDRQGNDADAGRDEGHRPEGRQAHVQGARAAPDLRRPAGAQGDRLLRHRPAGDREDRVQGPGHPVGRAWPRPGTLETVDVNHCAPTTRRRPRRCSPRPATARRSR